MDEIFYLFGPFWPMFSSRRSILLGPCLQRCPLIANSVVTTPKAETPFVHPLGSSIQKRRATPSSRSLGFLPKSPLTIGPGPPDASPLHHRAHLTSPPHARPTPLAPSHLHPPPPPRTLIRLRLLALAVRPQPPPPRMGQGMRRRRLLRGNRPRPRRHKGIALRSPCDCMSRTLVAGVLPKWVCL